MGCFQFLTIMNNADITFLYVFDLNVHAQLSSICSGVEDNANVCAPIYILCCPEQRIFNNSFLIIEMKIPLILSI